MLHPLVTILAGMLTQLLQVLDYDHRRRSKETSSHVSADVLPRVHKGNHRTSFVLLHLRQGNQSSPTAYSQHSEVYRHRS